MIPWDVLLQIAREDCERRSKQVREWKSSQRFLLQSYFKAVHHTQCTEVVQLRISVLKSENNVTGDQSLLGRRGSDWSHGPGLEKLPWLKINVF